MNPLSSRSRLARIPAPSSAERVDPGRSSGRPLRIVGLGGGTGLPAVLRGLASSSDAGFQSAALAALTAIVTVTDDGGSSGRLRKIFGVQPPGDVRNCLCALATHGPAMTELLNHRFSGTSELAGHAVGNLLLVALTQITGDFASAVERLAEILAVRGRVLPSTREPITIRAELESGEIVEGETAIVARRARIRRLSLERDVRPLPDAIEALINADAIVVGPGSLYSSVLPNLLVDGIAATMSGVNAARIYVANLMTEPGETDGFSLQDHLRVIREHVGFELFDYVLVNERPVSPAVESRYAARGACLVEDDLPADGIGWPRAVRRRLAWEQSGTKIRHAPSDLGRAIRELAEAGRPAGPRPLPVLRTVVDVAGHEGDSTSHPAEAGPA